MMPPNIVHMPKCNLKADVKFCTQGDVKIIISKCNLKAVFMLTPPTLVAVKLYKAAQGALMKQSTISGREQQSFK